MLYFQTIEKTLGCYTFSQHEPIEGVDTCQYPIALAYHVQCEEAVIPVTGTNADQSHAPFQPHLPCKNYILRARFPGFSCHLPPFNN
jgi:hypothetical protein